jgi:hypothetical protein
LARMRKVGNFSDCGQTRPDIPTLAPAFFHTQQESGAGVGHWLRFRCAN